MFSEFMYKSINRLSLFVNLFVFLLLLSQICNAQTSSKVIADTTQARIHLQRGDSLKNMFFFKPAFEETKKASDIYLNGGFMIKYWDIQMRFVIWLKYLINPEPTKAEIRKMFNQVIKDYGETHKLSSFANLMMASLMHHENKQDSSFLYTKKALKIYQKHNKNIIEPFLYQIYSSFAQTYQEQNQHDSAFVYYKKALKVLIEDKGKDNPYTANINRKIAWVYLAQGDYKKALSHFQKVLKIRQLVYPPIHIRIADAYAELGRIYLFVQQIDSAYNNLNKAINIYYQVPGNKKMNMVNAYYSMAQLYDIQGNYELSLKYNLKAMNTYTQTKRFETDKSALITFYLIIGTDYHNLGEFDKALVYFQKGHDLGLKIHNSNHIKVAEANINIGKTYLAQGLYHKALDYHQRALAIIQQNPAYDKQVPVQIHRGLASIYAGLNDPGLALKYYEKALNIESTGKSIHIPKLNEIYLNMGELFVRTKQPHKALNYFHKALLLLKGNIKKVNAYLNLAKTHYTLKQIDSTFFYTQKALDFALSLQSDQNFVFMDIYQAQSNLLFKEKNYFWALDYAQKAIKANLRNDDTTQDWLESITLDNIIRPSSILDGLQLMALSQEQIYLQNSTSLWSLEQAFLSYQKTDNLMGQMRLSYDYEADQLEFARKSYKIYMGAIRVSALLFQKTKDTKYQKAAFYFAEKSKAYLLYTSLLDANAREFAGIPKSLLEHDRILKIKIAYFQKEVAKLKKDQMSPLRDSLFQCKLAYSQLIQSFEKDYPDYFQLKYNDQPTSIDQIQASLKPSSTLLEYVIDEQNLYTFFISQNQFIFKHITLNATDQKLLKKYPAYLRQFNERKYLQAASHLYNLLILPFAENLTNKKHIIFVNNGLLHKIPMETLLTNPVANKDVDFRSLPYLLQDYTTSYFPSATLAVFQQKQKPPLAAGFLGFAPVFKAEDNHGNLLGVSRAIIRFRGSDSTVVVNGQHFEPLPYSEDELIGIKTMLQNSRHSTNIFLHNEATEGQFKAQVGNYRYVHVASHSWANETNGLLSYILFSQPDSAIYAQSLKAGNGQALMEDGVLYANEMYSLDWNADLVVLSSCKSGLGEYVAGEGVLTFTRGLLYGGAHNVLYSLWNVNDEATANLMLSFYKNHFQKQMSYSESLRAAKLTLLKDPQKAFPYWWAAFSLLGRE